MFKAYLDNSEFHTSLGYVGRHCFQKETGRGRGKSSDCTATKSRSVPSVRL